ncbi:SMC-Scp complex subunit ScpB [Luteimonas chenhongjianii]|uniref:SMC-Scp complex subunit ScpB n=1 Tax=Luteimonas chenhongjianii TaxID=2006110 RepID=A0A290XFC5_9GAMM|nr:SMC-Scp complex subunit ScpB [Luteimonas chenhongjianii]
MDQTFINRVVEAALLASSQPLSLSQLETLFTLDEPAPEGSLKQALVELQAACVDRGVELVELASGWRYQVRSDVHAWVSRLWTERQTRYTRATLETLALIAYRQPITRGEIEQVRGVATNSNIIKALEEREWIRVVGHRDMPGRPELLGTTKAFLDYFGLRRLDDLPPLSELKDFAELDPQLRFAGTDTETDRTVGGIGSSDTAEADADTDTDTDADTRGAHPSDPDQETGAVGTDESAGEDDADIDAGSISDARSAVSDDTDVQAPQRDDGGTTADAAPDAIPPDDTSGDDTSTDEDNALAVDGDSDRSHT